MKEDLNEFQRYDERSKGRREVVRERISKRCSERRKMGVTRRLPVKHIDVSSFINRVKFWTW